MNPWRWHRTIFSTETFVDEPWRLMMFYLDRWYVCTLTPLIFFLPLVSPSFVTSAPRVLYSNWWSFCSVPDTYFKALPKYSSIQHDLFSPSLSLAVRESQDSIWGITGLTSRSGSVPDAVVRITGSLNPWTYDLNAVLAQTPVGWRLPWRPLSSPVWCTGVYIWTL